MRVAKYTVGYGHDDKMLCREWVLVHDSALVFVTQYFVRGVTEIGVLPKDKNSDKTTLFALDAEEAASALFMWLSAPMQTFADNIQKLIESRHPELLK